MSYAPNGDVLSASDSVNGNWTYGYDDFNRLLSSNKNSGAAVYSYVYDRFGNRLQQNGPYTMLLTFSGNNNRMDGYTYDAAGNVTYDKNNNYTYDAENRIASVTGTLGTTTYTYDANGRRVRKSVGGVTTDYVYDPEGHAIVEVNGSGGANREEIFAGGKHLATYVNNTTYFSQADWLGTERVRSDMTGAACETISSLPFGDGQTTSGNCGDPSTRHFTNKERDPESGNDYFGARYMGSSLARFMSPDPLMTSARLYDPQTWNRYSYALNNPLAYIDPNGKWSTPIHNRIINDVFRDILNQHEREILRQASVYVDDDQSSAGSYKHGMRAGNITVPDQTPAEAAALGAQFVVDQLNLAVNEQLAYEEPGGKGNDEQALYDFGQAVHTVADAESPWHDHYQEAWYGGLARSDWQHVRNESKYGPGRETQIAMAEYQVRVLWNRYQQMLKQEREKRQQEKEQEERKKKNKKTQ